MVIGDPLTERIFKKGPFEVASPIVKEMPVAVVEKCGCSLNKSTEEVTLCVPCMDSFEDLIQNPALQFVQHGHSPFGFEELVGMDSSILSFKETMKHFLQKGCEYEYSPVGETRVPRVAKALPYLMLLNPIWRKLVPQRRKLSHCGSMWKRGSPVGGFHYYNSLSLCF